MRRRMMTMWLITVKPSHLPARGNAHRQMITCSRIVHRASVRTCYNSLEDRNPLKGNTVGSRSNTDKAYIAGFLDGDGSIMLQIKKRSDTTRGVRFMATICLYQDTRHEKPLHWIRDVLGIGYVSRRRDGISELRINGFGQVRNILRELRPFIRFKERQTSALIRACTMLEAHPLHTLSKRELNVLVDLVFIIRNENYKSKSTLTKAELCRRLGLTP